MFEASIILQVKLFFDRRLLSVGTKVIRETDSKAADNSRAITITV